MTDSQFTAAKATILISYLLSVIGTFYYLFYGKFDKQYETPFTPSIFIVVIYSATTLLLQALFIIKTLYNPSVNTNEQANILALVGPHFSINNVLNFFWTYYFIQGRFIVSEVILVVNLLNLLALYFSHNTVKIKSMSQWALVHFPVTGMPLSWTNYALFWNGACMFHSHYESVFPRILANVSIWEFLFVPLILLVLYQDWSVSLSTSFLMLGLGIRQAIHQTITLQWVFAFAISGIDFLASVVTLFGCSIHKFHSEVSDAEQAPLITEDN